MRARRARRAATCPTSPRPREDNLGGTDDDRWEGERRGAYSWEAGEKEGSGAVGGRRDVTDGWGRIARNSLNDFIIFAGVGEVTTERGSDTARGGVDISPARSGKGGAE